MVNRTKAAFAVIGCAVGFFSTYLVTNAALGKRGIAAFEPHDQAAYYLLDMLGGIACAGLAYVLPSLGVRRTISNANTNVALNSALIDSSGLLPFEQDSSREINSVNGSAIRSPSPNVHPSIILKPRVTVALDYADNEQVATPRLTVSPEAERRLGLNRLNPSPMPAL